MFKQVVYPTEPVERVFEITLRTREDVREAMAMIAAKLDEANREGKDLILELWKEVHITHIQC